MFRLLLPFDLCSAAHRAALPPPPPQWSGQPACRAAALSPALSSASSLGGSRDVFLDALEEQSAPQEHGGFKRRRTEASAAALEPAEGASGGTTPSFEVVKAPGDGSCLFSSLAAGHHYLSRGQLLSGTELRRAAFAARQAICEQLLARQAEFQPFVDGSFSAYMYEMTREGTWGGEVELAAAPGALGRPVIVYQQARSGLFGAQLQKVSQYGAEAFRDTAPLCVLFSGAHYDLLLQRDE